MSSSWWAATTTFSKLLGSFVILGSKSPHPEFLVPVLRGAPSGWATSGTRDTTGSGPRKDRVFGVEIADFTKFPESGVFTFLISPFLREHRKIFLFGDFGDTPPCSLRKSGFGP